jgi:hypothetical protein
MHIYTYTHFSAHTQTHLHAPHAHTHSSTHTLSPAHPPAPTLVKFLNCFFSNPPTSRVLGFRLRSPSRFPPRPPASRLCLSLSVSLFLSLSGVRRVLGGISNGEADHKGGGPLGVFQGPWRSRRLGVCVCGFSLYGSVCICVSVSLMVSVLTSASSARTSNLYPNTIPCTQTLNPIPKP